jgi:glucose/arabinose dehydrogenase
MTLARAATAAAVLVLLGACSQSDGGPATTTTTTNTTTTITSTTSDATKATGTTTSASPPKLALQSLGELSQPLALAVSPPSGDVYVAEKGGRVQRRQQNGGWAVALDLSSQVSTGGEQGLLGLAIAPDGKHAYVDYTNREGDTRVVEYAVGGDGAFDAASARQLLAVDQPFANHNGGEVTFGPDGLLYVGLGDGGNQGDPNGNGQNPDVLLGKIVRIDTSAARAQPEVWAFGLRNPWRFSFDRETHDVWIGDVGGSQLEEIDHSPAGAKGVNYGWDRMEGTRRTGEGPVPDGSVLPVHEYATGGGGCAVTGGYVYRGKAIPGLRGYYLFGDFCRGQVQALRADQPGDAVDLGLRVASLASFGEDLDGELYVLSLQGDVSRVVAA